MPSSRMYSKLKPLTIDHGGVVALQTTTTVPICQALPLLGAAHCCPLALQDAPLLEGL